jgi:hypothetical protein
VVDELGADELVGVDVSVGVEVALVDVDVPAAWVLVTGELDDGVAAPSVPAAGTTVGWDGAPVLPTRALPGTVPLVLVLRPGA